ncbi:UDP-glucosyl transferase 73C7 [Actinidia rufa]|uniref:UDP-glucosyl transferase 73C7 n=1 Tax=Actinidia rufa TaxID=165716 RepID=A0A7J0FUL0_9ERIC|nr:UDP-glucosyl transferase 73C7 [Actinidia rufa]
MVDMAKLLAQHGVRVTIVTTTLIAARLRPNINRAISSGLPLRLLHLPFPSMDAGLPEGCETFESIPSPNLLKNFIVATGMLQIPFERLFELLEPKPNCIIADKNLPWVAETARKFHVLRITFDGMSCFTRLCTHNLQVSRVHESLSESEPFVLPGLPDTIEMTKSQLPRLLNPGSLDSQDFGARVTAAEEEAYGMVVNSFEELEPRYVNGFRNMRGGRVWCIGPLSLCNKDNLDKAQRGNKASIDENQCLKWLDTREPGTVVYACLGSLSRLTLPQLAELGFGLELSNHPFVWVIKGGYKAEEIDMWIEKDGFEERTKGRGLIIREQFLNEKLVVKVLETGVSVGAQAAVPLYEEDKFGVLVKREAVMRAVDDVIKGEERRKRARELREMAKRAVEEGGSSYLNVRLLIQDVMQQLKEKGPNEEHSSS